MSERDPVSADPMTAGATTPTPWARARAILEEVPATYWLATVRPNGAPHARPVLAEGAPTAGPPPYDVYEATPTAAFGFGTDERFVPTRWRFGEPTT
jgi:hypothetical protein